jgi:hypothetical protein
MRKDEGPDGVPLTGEELDALDADWRAADHLSVRGSSGTGVRPAMPAAMDTAVDRIGHLRQKHVRRAD